MTEVPSLEARLLSAFLPPHENGEEGKEMLP
jgi:hypothetical protein